MFLYLTKKIATALLTLFTVALLSFLMARAVPGGPFDNGKALPPQVKQLLEKKYGFDQPPLTHFYRYAKAVLLHGDFGVSLKFVDRPVTRILGDTVPISFELGGLALLFAIAIGVPLGILSAWKPNTFLDTGSMFLAVSGLTLPAFLIGAILVLIFCTCLGWLPPARIDEPGSFILPVVTLGLRPAAIVARLIRATLIEQLKMDYVRTARAKGVSEIKILLRHGLRNTVVPIVAVMGPVTANILTGSFIVEEFFAIPGVAKYFVDAVNNRDIFLMEGVTLVFAATLIGINLLCDLIYPFLDPRMKIT